MQWGQTPWDTMTKDELLREVQRMFSALESAKSVLGILKVQNEASSFWGIRGSGGRALERAAQVIDPIYETYDAESVYRSFFRYAASLLFDVADEEKWIICPTCGSMWSGKETMQYVGSACSAYPIESSSTCMGILRPLEWKDLTKLEDHSTEKGDTPHGT